MVSWPLKKALSVLVGSVCVTFVLSLGGAFSWSYYQERKLADEKYQIKAIVQTGPEKEALKSAYLAELLGLSVDSPTSLYAMDCKKAETMLLASPLISHAIVKRLDTSAIYIDYEVRKPIAFLADYKNIGVDREGYLFPIAPFFTPKEIPEIYLGLPPFGAGADSFGRLGGQWHVPLQDPFWHLALEILDTLEEVPWKEGFRVKKIDVSNGLAPSLGQREIVLMTEEEFFIKEGISCIFPKLLRLAPKDYAQQIANFCLLRRNIEDDYRKQLAYCTESRRFAPRIIDLRIPQLGFVENRP